MQKFDEWMMPDGETHLPDNMTRTNRRVLGRLSYQYSKYEKAKEYIKNFRTSVDVGAHVGLWSFYLSSDFDRVEAFEPMQAHIDCFHKNMAGIDNFNLYPVALGAFHGNVALAAGEGESSGDTKIIGVGEIKMVPLDDFDLQNVDFLKIDCEGYEMNVLKGALNTIERCKPCIIVEQKRDMSLKYDGVKLGAVKLLQNMGAVVRGEISGDYILSWE